MRLLQNQVERMLFMFHLEVGGEVHDGYNQTLCQLHFHEMASLELHAWTDDLFWLLVDAACAKY